MPKIKIPGDCYLVGGALRDALLGVSNKNKDRDWVIVGASIEQMLEPQDGLSFQQVGKEFPVFLHPITKEEYALARKERKSSQGHTGFICDFSPDISLEDDLIRRDLSINAMAIKLEDISFDQNNNLVNLDKNKIIDPYNGLADIKNKYIKHVSDAFIEDPLRVLRAYRFLARFYDLGFKVHPDTILLMQNMIEKNELAYLSRPRVFQEIIKAMSENSPDIFFSGLQDIKALKYIFNNSKFNIDFSLLKIARKNLADINSLSNISNISDISDISDILFILSYWLVFKNNDISNNIISKNLNLNLNLDLPLSRNIIKLWGSFIRVTKDYNNLLNYFENYNNKIKDNFSNKDFANLIISIFYKLDVWRNPEILGKVLFVLSSVNDFSDISSSFNQFLLELFIKFNKSWVSHNINLSDIAKSGIKGIEMEKYVKNKRIEILLSIL